MQNVESNIIKSTRDFFSGIGFRYIVFFFAVFGTQIAMQFLWMYQFGIETLETSLFRCLAMALPVDAIGTPVLVLLFLPRIRKDKEEDASFISNGWQPPIPIKMTIGKFLKYVCMLVPVVVAGSLISLGINAIISLITGVKYDSNLVLESFMSINVVGRLIVTCVCAPIFEELVFRKLLIDRMVKHGEQLAVIMSGLMFGLFHGNFEQLFYACFLGMFFAYIYIRTGKIIYTMIFHFLVNFSSAGIAQTLVSKLDTDLITKVSRAGIKNISEADMARYMEGLPWLVAYYIWFLFMMILFVVGLIFWILAIANKKISYAYRPLEIPKGLRMKLAIANPGMILYILLCLALCIYTVVAEMNT